MKKIALISALMSLSVFQAANAADGVINFTGNITGTACVVDTSAISQPVDLGTISTTAFTGGNGATAAAKRFNIVLKSCPASVSSASIVSMVPPVPRILLFWLLATGKLHRMLAWPFMSRIARRLFQ